MSEISAIIDHAAKEVKRIIVQKSKDYRFPDTYFATDSIEDLTSKPEIALLKREMRERRRGFAITKPGIVLDNTTAKCAKFGELKEWFVLLLPDGIFRFEHYSCGRLVYHHGETSGIYHFNYHPHLPTKIEVLKDYLTYGEEALHELTLERIFPHPPNIKS